MPDHIVFLLKAQEANRDRGETNREEIIGRTMEERIQKIGKKLEQYGVHVTSFGEWVKPEAARQGAEQSVSEQVRAAGKVLYLPDNERDLLRCMEEGAIPVAFLHENNGQEKLNGTLLAVSEPWELDAHDWERLWLRTRGRPWDILETERLFVRETTVEDVEAFYKIYEEPEITQYMEGLFEDPEEERSYTRDYIEKIYFFYGFGMWTVLKKNSREVIGRAGLSYREGFEYPELGFLIGVRHQRKGYAEEVCRGILNYGCAELDFQQIQALVRRENKASASLCKKLGFQFLDCVTDRGIDYDRYLYSSRRVKSSMGI